jgi:hypothetical protein
MPEGVILQKEVELFGQPGESVFPKLLRALGDRPDARNASTGASTWPHDGADYGRGVRRRGEKAPGGPITGPA